MKEIKFLKDLPCKLTNTNTSSVNLVGGDVYYDKDGNRYAYLTFKNLEASPIFAFQIAFREYSADGKLIKEGEFYNPYMYAQTGEFVNESPIEIDQETEAMEIYISKVTFDKANLVEDRMEPFTNEDYVKEPARAPKKRWDGKSEFTFNKSRPNMGPSEARAKAMQEEEEIVNSTPGSYSKVGTGIRWLPIATVAIAAIAIVAAFFIINMSVNSIRGW